MTARADEYIELFNATDEPVDLTDWQLRYITASEASTKTVQDPSSVITITPPLVGEVAALLPVNGHYLIHSGAIILPQGVLGQTYEGMLPATGGSLVLVRPNQQTCEFEVIDALAWGTTTHLFGEGEALVPGASSAKDKIFQRYVDATDAYVESGNNSQDFLAADTLTATSATPGARGSAVAPTTPLPGSGSASLEYPETFADTNCTIPDPPTETPVEPPESPPSTTSPPEEEDEVDVTPVIPAANVGLKPPQLSEFLPNPGSPQTDANDEYIELYNPNDKRFDLSGYALEVG